MSPEPSPLVFKTDWLAKTSAGALLGLALAFAISGLFAWLGPGGIDAPNKVQFNMWIIPPLWLAIFGTSYCFRNGLRAWCWLGGSNLVAWLALILTRNFLALST